MQLPEGTYCPLLKRDCIGLKCAWIMKIQGVEKNTGKEVEEWQCAVKLLPMLMIENSQVGRETGAAVESFRNEMVKANQASNLLTAAALKQRLLGE
jgi:hypothetical protein